ncbi:MAG: PAS domain S-box protein [Cyanobacteriota bacterium]|nr:PAS domain S-box protein [Cyanobacteriota bacterium]
MCDRSHTLSSNPGEQAAYFHSLIEHTPAAIAIFDCQMGYVAASQRWRSDYNLGDISFIGRSHYEIFPEIGDRWRAIHQRCLAGAIERCDEEAFPRADGSLDWVRWEVRPWYSDSGEIGGIIMLTEVITRRKQAELALQAANSQLEAKVKERTANLEQTVARLQQEIEKRQAVEAELAQSEAKFRHLVENVEDTIWSCLPDGTLTYLSPAFEKMFGFDRAEFVGHPFAPLVHPEDLPQLMEFFDRTLETGKPHDCTEFRHKCQDGSWCWVVSNISASQDEEGNIVAIQGTLKDISDRVAAEAKLKQQQQLLQAILDNTNACIFVKDYLNLDGQYVLANQQTADLFDIPQEEFCGKTDYDLFPEEVAKQLESLDRDILKTLHRLAIEEEIPQGDGTRIYWTQKFPLEDEAGRPYALCGVATDITDFKVMEAALRQSEAQFRALFEHAAIGVAKVGLDGQWLMVNQKLCDSLGYAPAELLESMLYLESIAPADRQTTKERLKELYTGTISTSSLEKRYLRRDGTSIWMQTTAKLVRNDRGEAQYFVKTIEDISNRKRQEHALRFIVEGTVAKTGNEFFRACVGHLAEIFQVQYAFVTESVDNTYTTSRMLALWTGEEFVEPYEFDLEGSPCRVVFQEHWGIFTEELQARFPQADSLATLGAQSYLGVAIVDTRGQAIGNLGLIDTKPFVGDLEIAKSLLQLFATRVGAEMERMRAEAALRNSRQRLHQQAGREKLLNQLTQQILHSLDFSTIVNRAVGEIQRFLKVDRCHFAWHTLEPNGEYWDVIDEVRAPDLPSFLGRHPVRAFGLLSERIFNRQTLKIDDVRAIEVPAVHEFLTGLGNRSMLVLPVLANSSRLGIISCIHTREVRPWLEEEVELLEAIVTQLAIALDRANLFAQSQTKASELAIALKTLQRTQAQLVQHEKMSSLGQMVAGIAHEINNPLSFIYGNIVSGKEYMQDLLRTIDLYERHYPEPPPEIVEALQEVELDYIKEDIVPLFESMSVGTKRISEIVQSLHIFSRLDEAEVKAVDLHDGIESSLTILRTRLRAQSWRSEIQVVRNYARLPQIECCAGQLNQVFMNILSNAIDALEERDRLRAPAQMAQTPSTIRIQTEAIEENEGDRWLRVRIADNGPGIDEKVRAKLFDPFFTTKPVGKGTGLGLSISYQIVVERHNGRLSCQSTPGKGAEFIIEIPFL